jgi:hypothetical protein
LTGHQKFYIFVLDGLGGMALSAGVNFAIAYGERDSHPHHHHHHHPLSSHP